MSPDDMADYHEHMIEWCHERWEGSASAFAHTWSQVGDNHRESARYWREKAKENE